MTTHEAGAPELHIALICPFSSGPGRGNLTSVRRIAAHLPATGCRITRINLDIMTPETWDTLLDRDRPDLLHAFHAYYAGPTARLASHHLGIPYLITITGSDLFDPSVRNTSETRQAILAAAALTCFDPLVAEQLTVHFPQIADRLSVIPQGVAALPLKKTFPGSDGDFLILLPTALRPVKGVRDAIAALTPLALEFPALRLLVAGGTIDPDYAGVVQQMAAALLWVHLLGDVPFQQMGDLYAAADLVLNSSVFEGGMANSLLEAMVMGKPVLASDVLGNRSLIRHDETGWLYGNDHELRHLLRLLLLCPERGTVIGQAGQRFVQEHCSPLAEASNYAALYRRLVR